MECGKCQSGQVANDLPVKCAGVCGKEFHLKCTSLTRTAAKLITDNVNVLYKCDTCLSSQRCGGQSDSILDVKQIEKEGKKISSISASINDVRDQIALHVDNAIKSGMETIRLNVNDTLKEVIGGVEKLMNAKLDTINESFSKLIAENTLAVKNNCIETEKTPDNSSNSNDKDESTGDNDKSSFADVLKKTKGNGSGGKNNNSKSNNQNNDSNRTKNNIEKPKDRKTRPVIVIKPIQSKQDCEETRKFLKTKLDPKTHKISNFRNGKDGSIIAECALGYNVNEVKKGIESNLGESYSAVVPTSVPLLKVVGMSEQYSSDVFIDYLKSQNEDIAINDVKIINMYENPRFVYNKFNVVIEVDHETYRCMTIAKKVNVGFDRCLVVPAINVLRCFKCGEFGHKSMDCKNGERCSRCSKQHNTSKCTSTVMKCVNCLKANKERKLNLDVNHPAFSASCLVYKKLYEQKKSSLHFNK